ncbi:hypothetical protein OUZ56_024301 [Daphnia magna]|uniref:Uncharacterized protein n=1 Tax=Daphnia magna TaxID=35525 RepID=A0ABR0B0S0_9CRUS|nr:hypothetical protein OUZ56_024301 [Daphnia magna]
MSIISKHAATTETMEKKLRINAALGVLISESGFVISWVFKFGFTNKWCLRTNAICSVWQNGTVFNPQVILPSGNGWQLVEEKYSPVWFQGDMVPTTIEDMILDSSNEEEKDEDATDVSSDEADDESDCSLSDVD